MNIATAGIGFVGMSNAVLLAQHNARQSPIEDPKLQDFLAKTKTHHAHHP